MKLLICVLVFSQLPTLESSTVPPTCGIPCNTMPVCVFGFAVDSNGCPLCDCKPNPDPSHPCLEDYYYFCTPHEVCIEKPASYCFEEPCYPVTECVPFACPAIEEGYGGCSEACSSDTDCLDPAGEPMGCCSNGCGHICVGQKIGQNKNFTVSTVPPACGIPCNTMPICVFGFAVDSNGCPLCDCKPNPDPSHPCLADYVYCAPDEVCVEKPSSWCDDEEPCYPMSECVPFACPAIGEGYGGCWDACSSDYDCQDPSGEPMRCCSNGCGHLCVGQKIVPLPVSAVACTTFSVIVMVASLVFTKLVL